MASAPKPLTTGRTRLWPAIGRFLVWCLLLGIGMCHFKQAQERPAVSPEPTVSVSGFERALPLILKYEGGYVNNPADTGGATNKGVTQRVYDAYREDVGLPKRDVRRIEAHEVSDIYEQRYWDAVGCDALPYPEALVCFDSAVNHGTGRTKRFIREVGTDPHALIARRERFYHAIVASRPEAKVFLKGWMNRLTHLKREVARHAD